MWDTWIYKNPNGGWMLNYLVKHHPGPGAWNAVSTALSTDGAHWSDLGVSIRKDCSNKTDCAAWLGSGSVWKHLKAANAEDQEDEYIMNYSQEYDCGGGNCQSIFFSTSKDLLNWTPVAPDAQTKGGLVFKYNSTGGLVSDYSRGRWDCIAVLPKPGGGYYGYWTAMPTPQVGNPAHGCAGSSNKDFCGAGFGESPDGLNWKTLPTPGPNIQAEVGGLAQIGNTTYMTFNAGHLFEAPGPSGPFTAAEKNYKFMTQEGGLAFARLWGELYTGDPDLVLLTHQQLAGPTIYLGLVKQVLEGDDGVLRAVWWPQNDVLKGGPLPITLAAASSPAGTMTTPVELGSGLWLEGALNLTSSHSGIWLETSSGGFALTLEVNPTGSFALGAMASPGKWDKAALRVDRAMAGALGVGQWKALLRNSRDGYGMVEFYVDGVLSLPWTVGKATFTGGFAMLGNATVSGAHRLSLPAV